jgi:hypothetical protein
VGRYTGDRSELQARAGKTLDVRAAVAAALAPIRRLQKVLAHGTIVEQKDFLLRLVAGITIYPSRHEGGVRFHELLPMIRFGNAASAHAVRELRESYTSQFDTQISA